MNRIVLKNIPWSNPEETLKKGIKLISRKAGIIRNVASIPCQVGDLPIYTFGIIPSNTNVFHKFKFGGRASGAGTTIESALAATIGETIERYCAIFFNQDSFIFSDYASLKEKAVHPNEWALFHNSQYAQKNFPFVPFGEKTKVHWTRGYSLIYNEFKLLPAKFVYLTEFDGEENIGYSTSTGLAGSNTLEEAILTALYEVIERDAFVIFWLNMLSKPFLDIKNFDFPFSINVENQIWRFVNITSDINIPVIFGVNISPFQFGKAVGVGCAARLNPKESLQKVVIEIAQARPYLRYELSRKPMWSPLEDFSNINTFEDHALVYTKAPELVDNAFSFFMKSNQQESLDKLPNLDTGSPLRNIKKILKVIGDAGYDVIVVDLTTTDIEEIGLHVVRVIIPGFIPLHGNHLYPFLGGERLYKVPLKLGYTPKKRLNFYPHPFP